MITAKLNLTSLKHGFVKGKTADEAILCIPVKLNNLFLSEKKNVYLDIVGFEFEDKTDKQYKDTHLLKQSFKKEELAAMTDEQKKSLPILGNARVASGQSHTEPTPNSITLNNIADAVGDLPF